MNFLGTAFSLVLAAIASTQAFCRALTEVDLGPASRVGFYIGTFDPFHQGHKDILEASLKQANLDYIIVIPTQDTAWLKGYKPNSNSFQIRSEMLMAQFRDSPSILIPDLVPTEGGVFQKEVMQYLKERSQNPRMKTFAIVGADVIADLDKIPDHLFLQTDGLITSERKGYEGELPAEKRGMPVIVVDRPQREISSTVIRNFFQGHPEFFFGEFNFPNEMTSVLDPAVVKHIHSQCIYCSPEMKTERAAHERKKLTDALRGCAGK